MEIFCHKCGTKNVDRDTCSNCNTQLLSEPKVEKVQVRTQEIVQLECPWCKTVNKVTNETNCVNCGGPLPAVPHNNDGLDKGLPPGSTPREIPKVYIKKLKYRNTVFMIGFFFTAFFFWTILFPIIGIFMMRAGLRTANKKLMALQNGIKSEGVLVDIYKDHSETVNGRNPWLLEYEFTTKSGELITAKKTGAWGKNNRYRKPNDHLWIVYMPDNPEISAIWPPVD